jgi:excisionase family DNA binding protein
MKIKGRRGPILTETEKLLTVKEVSSYLGVTKITLYTWIKEDKLKAFKYGKSWRISKEDLDNFINQYK